MPQYSSRNRNSLLAVAAPLSRAARSLFSDAAVVSAADAVDAAAQQLDEERALQADARQRLREEGAQVLVDEASLDRRVGAIARALAALSDLGDTHAEALLAMLYPEGVGAISGWKGRSQAAVYRAFAARLRDGLALPGINRLSTEMTLLHDDLLAWIEAVLGRDDAAREQYSATKDAQAATDLLRDALAHLDRTVAWAAGGDTSDEYRAWARYSDGLD